MAIGFSDIPEAVIDYVRSVFGAANDKVSRALTDHPSMHEPMLDQILVTELTAAPPAFFAREQISLNIETHWLGGRWMYRRWEIADIAIFVMLRRQGWLEQRKVPPDAVPKKLHPHFRVLLDEPSRAPARAVFREIGPWLTPSDPHFVSEFQFKQFDQRLWEVYLWSALREMGFDITQPEAPDFLCRAPAVEFTVEATTVTASTSGTLMNHPDPKTPEEMRAFLADYMPMKFGSSLTSKLNKKNAVGESYWERSATAGKPFVIAIADFHKSGGAGNRESGSMTYTQSAIWPYLYGSRVDWEMVDGTLVVRAVPVENFTYNGKVVPAGFFDLPSAENVSAVLFSNAGTLAKFDRMGVAAGFGAPGYRYFRAGLRLDLDPNAAHGRPFSEEITTEGYSEGWADELQLFHNPKAKHPLRKDAFIGIAQHFFLDGKHVSYSSGEPVLSSQTIIMGIDPDSAHKH